MSKEFAEARKLDPAASWDALPAQAQRALGIAAITMMVSARAADTADSFIAAIDACERRGMVEMDNVVEEFIDNGPPTQLVIDPATVGVKACRRCGCTEEHPCKGGRGWANTARTLCTACAQEALAC